MAGERKAPIWRRLVAGSVDGVLFVAAASLMSVALYMVSGGVLRAYTFAPATRCAPMASVSAEVAQAAQRALAAQTSRVVSAVGCRRVFLGLESGRFVSIALEAQQGETMMGATVFQPVDRAGRPVRPVSLGWVYPLAFILLMSAGEALAGTTPGKSGLGLRVVSAAGGRLGAARALARNLIVYGWLAAGALLVMVSPGAARLAPGLAANSGAVQLGAQALVAALALATLAMLAFGRPDPAYDRWTGARVVAG